jgi:hypothetical protein
MRIHCRKDFQRAFLLDNVECDDESCNNGFGRSFKVVEKNPFNGIDNIIMAAFYDIYEDVIRFHYCLISAT